MRDLIAAWLALAGRPTKLLEGFEEERLDVVRLQPVGLSALHLLTHTGHATRIHGLMRQGALFKQGLELRSINGVRNALGESGAHLRARDLATRLQQQLAQWPTPELELAEAVDDLATEGL